MGLEHSWNDTDRRNQKYWERNTIQCRWYVNEWVRSIGGMMDRGKLKHWERNIIQRAW